MVSFFLYIWIMCPIYAYQIKVIMYVSLRDKIVFYIWREVQYTERYDQVIMCIIIKSWLWLLWSIVFNLHLIMNQITIKTPTAYPSGLPQFIYGF
jgi:hypothetical protein